MSDNKMQPLIERTVQIMDEKGWIDISFIDLKKGHIFRLFEDDGIQVLDKQGNGTFTALSDAYINQDQQVLTIDMEEIPEFDNIPVEIKYWFSQGETDVDLMIKAGTITRDQIITLYRNRNLTTDTTTETVNTP